MAGIFEDASQIRRIVGEGVLLLGGPRAVLMQLAHPKVAAGVADHSGFEDDPFGRLRRTLETMYLIVFSDAPIAREHARRLYVAHERISGPGYVATDPDLLLWVHATLVDTSLVVYERFLHRLRPAEKARFYADEVRLGELLGIPRGHQPPDLPAFHEYMQGMLGRLEVTPTARELAHAVLHPPLPLVARPLGAAARALTAGLLPPRLRAGFGLGWGPAQERALRLLAAASRATLRWVPAPLRRAQVRLLTGGCAAA